MNTKIDEAEAGTVSLSESNFSETVQKEGIALVDCWASWCKACKEFQPVFEATAKRHPTHRFAKLNTQEEKKLVESLGINHIPTLMLFRDGLLLFKQPGYFDENGLNDIIAQGESLDMEEVKAAMVADDHQHEARK